MVRGMSATQQKLGEKLTILNDRGIGMLTRIYNIKKACSDAKSKPAFLSDKTLESCIKHVVRKFPVMDTKTTTLNPVFNIKTDIMKSLSLYYYTFVDLLDYKDHVSELLTIMDQCQLHLDITINYDLTKGYLDLVVTYVSLLVLLSRVEDRKAVLGLFNTAHEMTHGHSDPSFPRLGSMIIDYEAPMKKLSEEFVPHAKLLFNAVMSLNKIFCMRNLPADEWRKSQILSLVSTPSSMLNPAQTDVIQCEYLSLDAMERYLYFGFLLIHPCLQQPSAGDLFQKVLQCGWVTTLFRDEVVQTHPFAQQFFESMKGHNKRVSDIKDAHTWVNTNICHIHRERRKFLRSALKELGLILSDQPGLLGPKALLVFMALSFARDEIHWLLRHYDNPKSKKTGVVKSAPEELLDRQLPELLFHVEELRALVRKYNQVIQRYYVQYLTGYDAVSLNELMQGISMMPEEDSVIVESVHQQISSLSVKQVENTDKFDFRGLRLDWFRLQAYTSVSRYPLHLFDHRDLAVLMNMIVFHTKMIDSLDDMLTETSDLSLYCFYSKIFDEQFHQCLEFPAQTRFIIAFPIICGHFMTCNHDLCPEERYHIGDRSLTLVNGFLDDMSKEARNVISTICDKQLAMADQLLAKHVAPQISQVVNKKKRDKKAKVINEEDKPGGESYRRTREELTTMDKLHMALTELCFAINYCNTIHVWEHAFAPREYLTQHLENRFNKVLVQMVLFNEETKEIAKPSELLHSVRAYMSVLQTIENFVNIDVTRIFNNVLLQQTQPHDSHGERTVTSLYANWYLEVLLRKVSSGQIVYSPTRKAFVSLSTEGSPPFLAEEYSDGNELRALTELIGPYGMKYLSESLMWHISSQVIELRKLVIQNKDTLVSLRSNYDKPEQMKELFKRLQNVDNVLQRMSIIGVILCFRGLCQEALNDCLSERIPFLLSSIVDFKHNIQNGESLIVAEMASACGLPCKVDPVLVLALKNGLKTDFGEDEYQTACLLMVFVAVSLPKLAKGEASYYKPSLEAHANNIHCLAQGINGIASALFTLAGKGDIEERLKEFLALSSASLLRLGQETDKEAVKNRESVYLLLDMIVQESPFLTMDLLESCFPYALLRNAYHAVFKCDPGSQVIVNQSHN